MSGRSGIRADARRSTVLILDAAEQVLADDPHASLERIAEVAGLARTTVHRRFATRSALLSAVGERIGERYLAACRAITEAAEDDPRSALARLGQSILELQVDARLALALPGVPELGRVDGLEELMARLRAGGTITATDAGWCRAVCFALLEEVRRLPRDAPALVGLGGEDAVARGRLFARSVIGALGGTG